MTFMFDRCLRSWAAVTPTKYERHIQEVAGVLTRANNRENNGTEEINFISPTPGQSMLVTVSNAFSRKNTCIGMQILLWCDAVSPIDIMTAWYRQRHGTEHEPLPEPLWWRSTLHWCTDRESWLKESVWCDITHWPSNFETCIKVRVFPVKLPSGECHCQDITYG